MPETERFDHCVYHLDVRNDLMSWSSRRSWYESQFLPVDFAISGYER